MRSPGSSTMSGLCGEELLDENGGVVRILLREMPCDKILSQMNPLPSPTLVGFRAVEIQASQRQTSYQWQVCCNRTP
jgi:hypothetical protein